MATFNQLSGESITQFQEGISLTLSNWDALQAGIVNGFGNQNQVHNFAFSIFHIFHQPNRREQIYIDDLEQLLWNELVSFGIEAQDGSIEETAEDLMIMYGECLEGNFQSIQKLREQRSVLACVARPIVNDSDDDDEEEDDNDMMVDTQESLPMVNPSPMLKKGSSSQQANVDEDGWVTVPLRKNKGRNH